MTTQTEPPFEKKKVRFFTPFKGLFQPARYKVYYGGRGSAKSWSVARSLVVKAAAEQKRILCVREFQNSIADSVHRLLTDQIDKMELPGFRITKNSIESDTGSEFLFKGLRHNINEIKSTEGVDICWVEEGQRCSAESWDILIPTIRKPNSEIIISLNPDDELDPTYQRFIMNAPPNSIVRKVNYNENPMFPEVLREEMEYCKRVDYDAYLHIWEGMPKTRSKAAIFGRKYRVDRFDIPSDVERLYYGADWGFSADPTVLMKMFIKGNTLYIVDEAWGLHVEIEEIPLMFDTVKDSRKWPIKADCARPETISAARRKGFNIGPAKKWPGSVEDGIMYLRSFDEIVIHERCIHMAEEARFYSYKVDRVTGEILPIIVDKWNHCWDAVRYALDGYIKKDGDAHQSDMY